MASLPMLNTQRPAGAAKLCDCGKHNVVQVIRGGLDWAIISNPEIRRLITERVIADDDRFHL